MYRDKILHWYSNFGNLMNTKEHTNDLFLFTNSEKVIKSWFVCFPQLYRVTQKPVLIGN
jgi:hypothetical protein